MPGDATTERITQFITHTFAAARRQVIRDDDNLLEEGILDSVGVLDLVAFIEREFALRVDDDDLVPENFGSVARLTAFVHRRCNGGDGRRTSGR